MWWRVMGILRNIFLDIPDFQNLPKIKMADENTTRLQNLQKITCENLRHFKEALKNLRSYDDKIIYKLNVSVPTKSFQHEVDAESKCRTLYKELVEIYKLREDGIKNCIKNKAETIERLHKVLDQNKDDYDAETQLRSEQTSLRLIQSELLVEEVVKSRSLKVFQERCWRAYTPPSH